MKTFSDGIVTALVLEKGEAIHDSIEKTSMELDMPGAFITGIGVIKEVVLGFFDIPKKEYKEREYKGPVEMLSLSGNVAWKDKEPVVHLHVIIGFEDGSTAGGHLVRAKIGVTGELFLHKIGRRLERKPVEEFGLALIS